MLIFQGVSQLFEVSLFIWLSRWNPEPSFTTSKHPKSPRKSRFGFPGLGPEHHPIEKEGWKSQARPESPGQGDQKYIKIWWKLVQILVNDYDKNVSTNDNISKCLDPPRICLESKNWWCWKQVSWNMSGIEGLQCKNRTTLDMEIPLNLQYGVSSSWPCCSIIVPFYRSRNDEVLLHFSNVSPLNP